MPAEDGDPVRIAAVILNYRTPDMVVACLESVLPELDPQLDAVVVVDNASGDDSVEKLERAIAERGWGRVELVVSARNGGFAAGNNLGIARVEAEAYLLLNSDTLVRPGAVARLWQTLQEHPELGLLGPRIEFEDGTPQGSCFRLPTPLSELIAASGTAPVRRLLAGWDIHLPAGAPARPPDWTSFCAVLIRGETLQRAGPLDEGFFMYYEDVDYCRRVREAGFVIGHTPDARVVHHCGATSPVERLTEARERRPRYFYAARSRFFRRAHGRLGLLLANLLWTLGHGLARLREIFGGKEPHAVERELFDIWRG